MPGSGLFELHFDRRRLLQAGAPVALGSRAYDVLVALWERRSRVVDKAELLELVWPGLVVEENNLQVQIGHLRKVLGAQAIATVPGRGYRLTCELTGVSWPPTFAAGRPAETLSHQFDGSQDGDIDRAEPVDSRFLSEAVAACRRLVLIDMLTARRPGFGDVATRLHPGVDLGDARKVLEAATAALELRIAASGVTARLGDSTGLSQRPDGDRRGKFDPPTDAHGATQPPWE